MSLKEIVDPKKKIVIIYVPHVIPNLYDFVFFCGTQREMFSRMYAALLYTMKVDGDQVALNSSKDNTADL